ncbi:response regulator [Candidatus Pacearchaeota archaeon]|nr:response regulator [Candidatus Pacearchaeota archaeon]
MNQKRVVIAEDDLDLLATCTVVLESQGYDVAAASNGRKALELIADKEPDLLITDLDMPEMNGYELINEVGRRNYDFPVIINSGHAFKPDLIKYNGSVKYFDKNTPFDIITKAVKHLVSTG